MSLQINHKPILHPVLCDVSCLRSIIFMISHQNVSSSNKIDFQQNIKLDLSVALADLGGGGRARHTPPMRDPILSFLHTFLPKSAHVGGPHPPMVPRPPYGKSLFRHCVGLTKGNEPLFKIYILKYLCDVY